MAHAGTYNANPLSATAGVAMLSRIADGEPQRRAADAAAALRTELSNVWRRLGVPGCVYGESSVVNYSLEPDLRAGPAVGSGQHARLQLTANADAYHALRCALIMNGVDIRRCTAGVSAAHGQQEIDLTAQAFEKALLLLREEGVLD